MAKDNAQVTHLQQASEEAGHNKSEALPEMSEFGKSIFGEIAKAINKA